MANTVEMKHVLQVGIIVPNAKKALDNFAALFGIDEDDTMLMETGPDGITDAKYYGKVVSFSLAIGLVNYAGVQFEFIQPLTGDANPYSDFLKEKGAGIHHINVFFKDYQNAMSVFEQKGYPKMITGKVMGASFDYTDLIKDMGLVLETSADLTEAYALSIKNG
jgi:hypothetical protein